MKLRWHQSDLSLSAFCQLRLNSCTATRHLLPPVEEKEKLILSQIRKSCWNINPWIKHRRWCGLIYGEAETCTTHHICLLPDVGSTQNIIQTLFTCMCRTEREIRLTHSANTCSSCLWKHLRHKDKRCLWNASFNAARFIVKHFYEHTGDEEQIALVCRLQDVLWLAEHGFV